MRLDPLIGISQHECPIRRLAVETGDVLARHRTKVFTRFDSQECSCRADSAQQCDCQSAWPCPHFYN